MNPPPYSNVDYSFLYEHYDFSNWSPPSDCTYSPQPSEPAAPQYFDNAFDWPGDLFNPCYNPNVYHDAPQLTNPPFIPSPEPPAKTPTRTRTLSTCTYIEKLYALINHPENKDVIDWTGDGRSFLFVMNDRFVNEVLARNFRSKKIDSFIRQLNGYGFHRVYVTRGCRLLNKRSEEIAVFTHPYFQRDGKRRHLIKRASPTSTPAQLPRDISPEGDYSPPRIISDEYRQGADSKIRYKMVPMKQKKQTYLERKTSRSVLGH